MARGQHDVVAAVGDLHVDQLVALLDVDGADPDRAWIAELRQDGLLHDALLGGEQQELILGELPHRHEGRQALVRLHGHARDDRLAARRARRLRDLMDLEPVALPLLREEHDVIVSRGDEQVLDPVVFLGMGGDDALAAAPLPAVRGDGEPLDVAGVGHGDDMSSSAIRSSIENSPWSATISVRRSSPKPCASSDSSSLRILRRRGLEPRISLHSLMNLRSSLSSSSSLVISRAVSRASRMLRISAACFSDSLKRLRKAASAVGTSFALRMIFTTSSMWSTAIFRPSRMCSRSCARFSSNSVRRVMTVWRCSMKCSSSSFRAISFGAPSTRASMIAPKVVCICVCLYSWFSTTAGTASRFRSMTIRMPSRSE